MLKCNSCELEVDDNYTDHWVKVSVEVGGIVYMAHYCLPCWTESFVRKLAHVVGVGKDKEANPPAQP